MYRNVQLPEKRRLLSGLQKSYLFENQRENALAYFCPHLLLEISQKYSPRRMHKTSQTQSNDSLVKTILRSSGIPRKTASMETI